MKFYYIIVVLLFCSCTSYKPVQSTQNTNNTQTSSIVEKKQESLTDKRQTIIKDSTVFKDSVFYSERVRHDTVFIEKKVWRTLIDKHIIHDTVYIDKITDYQLAKSDSINNSSSEVTVVEKHEFFIFDKMKEYLYLLILIIIATVVLYGLYRFRERRH